MNDKLDAYTHTGKNIVVFSDGTGQKGGVRHNTNVYKLFNMCENRTQRQIVYYDPGLGTNWRMVTGNLFGGGFSKNLIDCYEFIFNHFEANDRIFLFGFSRGAATVRSLASFIELFGILPKSRRDLISKAYKIYKKKNRKELAHEFIGRHHTMWAKVRFVGVWDTVAALGMPFKTASVILDRLFQSTFHNFTLGEGVEFARHALSIDDERKTFHPLVWDRPENGDDPERMKQVWFSGVHTDVGGGYATTDLSDITLKWMIREARERGLLIYEPSQAFQRISGSDPNVDGFMQNEQLGIKGKLFRRATRTWSNETHGEPCLHESVYERKKNQFNEASPEYKPWIFNHVSKENPCIEG